MNVSIPRSAYSRIRCATVAGSPTSAVPAPPRTSPTPAHRLGLTSNSSRLPRCNSPCAAGLRNQISRRPFALGDRLVVDVADEIVGCVPRFLFRLPHDHMQPNAEPHGSTLLCCQAPHGADFLFHLLGRLSPGEINVDLSAASQYATFDDPPK